jgi:hypothetical protein
MNALKSFWIIAILFSATEANGAPPYLDVEFQFAGYSTGVTTGEAGGRRGTDTLCQAEFGKNARLCTTREWWKTNTTHPQLNTQSGWAWVQPEIVSTVFPTETLVQMRDWTGKALYAEFDSTDDAFGFSCGGWNDGGSWEGTIVDSATATIRLARCDARLPVACCIPVTVNRSFLMD